MNPSRPNALWPLLACALATASFVSMDASVKTIAPRYEAVQLTFLRFASGSVFALALWLRWRTAMPRRADWSSHALRCALLLVTLVTYFHALRLLPLAQAVAMTYISPIFVSLLAIVVLGERPTRWIWLALALGLAGVGVSLWPELQRSAQPGAAARLEGLVAAALSAVAFSGVMILARQQAQRDSLWTILLVQSLLPAAVLAAPAAWAWQPLASADLGPVILMGAFATVGLLCLTWAFSQLEASRVAPVEYTSFVWAALLGYALFGEVPTPYTAATAALIVGGCLLLLRR